MGNKKIPEVLKLLGASMPRNMYLEKRKGLINSILMVAELLT